jgi:hypothetical protein
MIGAGGVGGGGVSLRGTVVLLLGGVTLARSTSSAFFECVVLSGKNSIDNQHSHQSDEA